MFPSSPLSSLKRPRAERQVSDDGSWHSSFKRLKVNEDHNKSDGEGRQNFPQQFQTPAGQDSFEASPQSSQSFPDMLSNGSYHSLYDTTIHIPGLTLDSVNGGEDRINYQNMNSFLGQLHLQRRLQQQQRREQTGPGTPRISNIHHSHHHQEQQQQQQPRFVQVESPSLRLQQQQFPSHIPPAASASLPTVRRHISADNPQQADSSFPSSSMSSLSSYGSSPSARTTWRPPKSKLRSDSKLF